MTGNRLPTLIIAVLAPVALAGKPPPEVFAAMEGLAKIDAALQVCFDSPAYKRMPANQALKFHQASDRASGAIEQVGRRYSDESVVAAYWIAVVTYKDDRTFVERLISHYGTTCSERLLRDSLSNASTMESKLRKLMK